MNDQLVSRLERYGDDVDRSIAARGGQPSVAYLGDRRMPRSRVGLVAFAASCVVAAGIAGTIAIGTGGGGDDAPAVAATPGSSTQAPAMGFDKLAPLFADGFPDLDLDTGVTTPEGVRVSLVAVLGEVCVKHTIPSATPDGTPFETAGSVCTDRAVHEAQVGPPILGSVSDPYENALGVQSDHAVYWGAVGSDVAGVTITDDIGTVYRADTIEAPDLPGTRLFGLAVPGEAHVTSYTFDSASGDVLYDKTACTVWLNWLTSHEDQAKTGEGGSITLDPPPDIEAAGWACQPATD